MERGIVSARPVCDCYCCRANNGQQRPLSVGSGQKTGSLSRKLKPDLFGAIESPPSGRLGFLGDRMSMVTTSARKMCNQPHVKGNLDYDCRPELLVKSYGWRIPVAGMRWILW
ncbi:MAG: hypothetical protein CMB45_04925 [Euryarchaeota archaeon]|nr:hypothetical protein [Euryarchaeota archaeon]